MFPKVWNFFKRAGLLGDQEPVPGVKAAASLDRNSPLNPTVEGASRLPGVASAPVPPVSGETPGEAQRRGEDDWQAFKAKSEAIDRALARTKAGGKEVDYNGHKLSRQQDGQYKATLSTGETHIGKKEEIHAKLREAKS
jgi:hypothetical protein